MAIAAKGEYALMGAPGDKEGIGAAWVFPRKWQNDLDPAGREAHPERKEEIEKGEFGYSVAISSEKGEYALIGAPAQQRRRRRGVGLPALGHDVGRAGAN